MKTNRLFNKYDGILALIMIMSLWCKEMCPYRWNTENTQSKTSDEKKKKNTCRWNI